MAMRLQMTSEVSSSPTRRPFDVVRTIQMLTATAKTTGVRKRIARRRRPANRWPTPGISASRTAGT